MRVVLTAICACVLFATAVGSALADWSNLLVNGNFATSLAGWYATSKVKWDSANAPGGTGGSAVMPEYAWGLLTQTVRVPDDNWNPAWHNLAYELKAQIRIYPTEDIHFKLGWWDDVNNPPAANSTPDHVITLGNFTSTNQQWKNVCFEGVLDFQPRWLSVRVEWNPNLNPNGDCHGWVDEISFKARCTGEQNEVIPEPMSVTLGLLGLATVAGSRRLRKS